MNLYKRVVNAVSNVVYKNLLKRGKNDAPDSAKLTAWLARRGMKNISVKPTNLEMKDEMLRMLRRK